MRTIGTARRRRLRGCSRRHRLALLTLAVSAVTWAWLQTRYSGATDMTPLLLEGVGVVVASLAALLAPNARSRRALWLVSTFVTLTTFGDAYWLLVVDPSGLSYLAGDVEPGLTITVDVIRYLALGLLLVDAAPRAVGQPSGWWASPGLTGRGALARAQAVTCATALLLVATPLGSVIDDGKSYSLFCFFDIVLAAAALAVLLQAAGGGAARPRGRERRLLTATAAGVIALAVADAAIVLSLTSASVAGGRIGYTFSVTGFATLVVTALLTPARASVAGGCLPPTPTGTRPHLVVAAIVAVRVVAPALVVVLSTAHLVTAAAADARAGGAGAAVHGAFTTAAPTGTGLGPATLGTVIAAVSLSMLQAALQVVHAQRDERRAAASERDDLTGAYSRRGLTAYVQRHLPAVPTKGAGAAASGPARRGSTPVPRHPRTSAPLTGSPLQGAEALTAATGSRGGAEHSASWTLALLDLDGFKAVNDTFGHDGGDDVLRTVVQRCAAVVGGHGIVARLGGDEFVLLLDTGGRATPTTQEVLQRLRNDVAAPATIGDGVTVSVGLSVGTVSIDPASWSGDLSALLKQADQDMYEHKRRRKQSRVASDRPTPAAT